MLPFFFSPFVLKFYAFMVLIFALLPAYILVTVKILLGSLLPMLVYEMKKENQFFWISPFYKRKGIHETYLFLSAFFIALCPVLFLLL